MQVQKRTHCQSIHFCKFRNSPHEIFYHTQHIINLLPSLHLYRVKSKLMLELLVFQFLNIFTSSQKAGERQTTEQYISNIFTYHFFSFYHIFSPASGYHHEGSRKEMCNKLLPVFHPIKNKSANKMDQ